MGVSVCVFVWGCWGLQVYATDGDDELGGSDLDMCVNDLLRVQVELEILCH